MCRKSLNTNDSVGLLLRGGGSENRKVNGSTPPLANSLHTHLLVHGYLLCRSAHSRSEQERQPGRRGK